MLSKLCHQSKFALDELPSSSEPTPFALEISFKGAFVMVRNMAKGAGITIGTVEAAVASVAAVAGEASARCRSYAVPCRIQNPVVATLAGGFVLADLANLVAFLAGLTADTL